MALFLCTLIGAIAGLIAGYAMKEPRYGLLADVAIGVVGGLMGGGLFGDISVMAAGLIGAIVAALVGAAILIGAFQAAKRNGLFAE
jgi:uncharacterized membrane protein YeaQ/YmgE (transglycosylase-associated protein family)